MPVQGSFESHTGPLDDRYDVAIVGGGLAGLTLALQLLRADPDLSLLVAEKRTGPAPEATFKVGESTVDLSAFYFAEELGLKDHLEAEQNRKMGLRYFYPASGNRDIAKRVENGRATWAAVPSYQLDRGRFENELWARNHALGAHLCDGCQVEQIELSEGEGDHLVTVGRDGGQQRIAARWLVDAAGRANLIKGRLGLARDCPHHINSSWFRLDGGLDLEDWSDDESWLARLPERGLRRLSTNHLMGEGYWVWMIPLASGPISIGVCADPRFHPWGSINTVDGLLAWLREHEPQLGDAVTPRQDQILDFLKVEDFAHDCERVYSPQRWCLTGDAGVFADPLYSPGSVVIAISNTFISDLIGRDRAGTLTPDRVEALNGSLLVIFRGILGNYVDQYATFGQPRTSAAKEFWDSVTGGGPATLLFRNGKLHDPEFLAASGVDYGRILRMGQRMRDLFRAWAAVESRPCGPAFVSQSNFPLVQRHHDELKDPKDDETLLSSLARRADEVEGMAVVIFWEALGALGDHGIDENARINPYAIGLDPDRWEEDGLFDGGLTLAEGHDRAPGLEQLRLPAA